MAPGHRRKHWVRKRLYQERKLDLISSHLIRTNQPAVRQSLLRNNVYRNASVDAFDLSDIDAFDENSPLARYIWGNLPNDLPVLSSNECSSILEAAENEPPLLDDAMIELYEDLMDCSSLTTTSTTTTPHTYASCEPSSSNNTAFQSDGPYDEVHQPFYTSLESTSTEMGIRSCNKYANRPRGALKYGSSDPFLSPEHKRIEHFPSFHYFISNR